MIETRTVHEQLIELCQNDLAAGRWQSGEQFPSERDLAATHSVSRATANKVLAKLVSEGWLEMRKGIGCFVSDRPTLFASLRQIESFTNLTTEQGFCPSTQVIEFQSDATAPDAVHAALQNTKKDRVIFMRRLRLIDDAPVILEERWLPAYRYPRLTAARLKGSFYKLCHDAYGLTVQREEAEISAALAPELPELHWDAPALRIEGVGFDSENHPLWYQVLHYHGARFSLNNTVDNAAAFPRISLNFNANNK